MLYKLFSLEVITSPTIGPTNVDSLVSKSNLEFPKFHKFLDVISNTCFHADCVIVILCYDFLDSYFFKQFEINVGNSR